jgi:hypothetical protein
LTEPGPGPPLIAAIGRPYRATAVGGLAGQAAVGSQVEQDRRRGLVPDVTVMDKHPPPRAAQAEIAGGRLRARFNPAAQIVTTEA